MTRRIYDQQTGNLELELPIWVDHGGLLPDGLYGEVGSTDLLRNTSSFTLLHVSLANL